MPDIDVSRFKFGKKPSVQDPRTLRLSAYLDHAALPPIPDTFDQAAKVSQYGMHLNDRLGCCVVAAGANQTEADSADATTEQVVPDSDVLAGYEAAAGYNPNDPNTDQGTDPLTFMKYWQATGIGGRKIYAYAAVDPTNEQEMKAAAYFCGGVQFAFNVPQSAMNQTSAGQPWDVVANDGGIVGGHMVYLARRTASTPEWGTITWNLRQPMTQRFAAKYGVNGECFAAIPAAWFNGQGQAPVGFNAAQLEADLAEITGQPHPNPTPPTPAATSTIVTATPNPAAVGQVVTVTATVTGASPTGSVQFSVAGGPSSVLPLEANGMAQTQMTFTAAGTEPISATYQGDSANAPSTSPTVQLVVQAVNPPPFDMQGAIQRDDGYIAAVASYNETYRVQYPDAAVGDLATLRDYLDREVPLLQAALAHPELASVFDREMAKVEHTFVELLHRVEHR